MATTALPTGERIDYAAILPQRTKFMILAGVLLGLFLAALDQTIVSTALPAIIKDFNGLDLVAWTSTGYLLASTAMVPIYGKLSDLYGRRIILVYGIIIFLIGSALCGISQNMIQLIAFRVIQGLGAAALTSTAFAVPADLFAPAERARYMGMFAGVFGLASVVGPFLGGLLTDTISWHWVFYVNVPLGIIALVFILRSMPSLASGIRAPIDWLGTIFLVLSVVPLLLGLTLDKNTYPWTSPTILGLLGFAAVSTAIFLYAETKAVSPILPLSLFRMRIFSVVIAASVLNGAAFFGAILFLSLYLVNVLGVSATAAGSAQIPLMIAFVGSSIIASNTVAKIGRYKPFIMGGFAILLVGFYSMTTLTAQSTIWDVTWRMVILGLGVGPALPLLNLALQNAMDFGQIGVATASRQFFQQLGQAIGAAVFGVILTTTLSAQITANLMPIVAELPPEARSHFDPAMFRSGSISTEGGSGSQAAMLASLPPQLQQQIAGAFKQSFATSITTIYGYGMVLVGLAFLLVAFGLPEIPLRKTTGPGNAPPQPVIEH